MRRIYMAAIASVAVLGTNAHAQSLDRMRDAGSLGNIIGSAEACDLNIDSEAVANWIEEKVPAEDMEFIGTLNMMTDGARYNLEEMDDLQKATHCIQVRRSAIANGLATAK